MVIEVGGEKDLNSAADMIAEADIPTVGVSAIPPTKLLLFFEEENDVKLALENNSPLWQIAENVCRWSEENFVKTRTTWVECEGIHPKWLS